MCPAADSWACGRYLGNASLQSFKSVFERVGKLVAFELVANPKGEGDTSVSTHTRCFLISCPCHVGRAAAPHCRGTTVHTPRARGRDRTTQRCSSAGAHGREGAWALEHRQRRRPPRAAMHHVTTYCSTTEPAAETAARGADVAVMWSPRI